MPFVWNAFLNTSIKVIDEQHQRIVVYINELEQANLSGNRDKIGKAINGVIDYTQSHFSYEESLLEKAGYRYIKSHKMVHDLFISRINRYAERHQKGEDVGKELFSLLSSWLINHIQHDDASYVSAVKPVLQQMEQKPQPEAANSFIPAKSSGRTLL